MDWRVIAVRVARILLIVAVTWVLFYVAKDLGFANFG